MAKTITWADLNAMGTIGEDETSILCALLGIADLAELPAAIARSSGTRIIGQWSDGGDCIVSGFVGCDEKQLEALLVRDDICKVVFSEPNRLYRFDPAGPITTAFYYQSRHPATRHAPKPAPRRGAGGGGRQDHGGHDRRGSGPA